MCGIVGIVGHSAVNQQIYDALTVLQHRVSGSTGRLVCKGPSVPEPTLKSSHKS